VALVTFKGWEGKWWRNIKPGRAAVDALVTVLPGSGALGKIGQAVGQRVGSKLIRRASSKIGRFFRTGKHPAKPGISTARRALAGGSKVTSGKLILGGKQAFSAGGTAFNIRNAAKIGGSVAAAGAGAGLVLGKHVQPSAAVSRASVGASPAGAAHPAPIGQTSAASSSSPMTSSSSGTKRCGCPAGQRMLCFKRKHNPEAEAKRRARRKAAREKSKARTAKRTAKAKAAVARRKSSRTARKVRKAVRRLRGKR
jgi:hypothetical protein